MQQKLNPPLQQDEETQHKQNNILSHLSDGQNSLDNILSDNSTLRKAQIQELQLELFQNILEQANKSQQSENFMRNVLIQLVEKKAVFTNILHFIKIDERSIKLNYNEKLFSVLSKIKKQLNLEDLQQITIADTSDENIILQLLTNFTDKLVEGGFNYFQKHSVDLQKIKTQYLNSQQINKDAIKKFQTLKCIIQQIKILHSDVQQFEDSLKIKVQQDQSENGNLENSKQEENFQNDFSNQAFLEKKEKNPREKIKSTLSIQSNDEVQQQNFVANKIKREFLVKVFMMRLIELQIIVPNIIKQIRIIHSSSRYIIPDQRGILIIQPSSEIIAELFRIPELQKFIQQHKLNHYLNDQFIQKFEDEQPNYCKADYQLVTIQYLQMVINNSSKFTKELMEVFCNEEFKRTLNQIQQLCGDRIKLIFKGRRDPVEEFQNFGCNILQIGTYLFKICTFLGLQNELNQIKVEQNDQWIIRNFNNRPEFEKPSSYTKPLFKHFIQKMIQLNKPFPLLLKLLHLTNFCVKVIPRKKVMTDIVQHPQFIKFMKIVYNYPIEDRTIAERIHLVCVNDEIKLKEKLPYKWPQIILSALQIIYEQRDSYRQVITDAVQNKQYQTILKELDTMEEEIDVRRKTKEYLSRLNEFVKEIQREYASLNNYI